MSKTPRTSSIHTSLKRGAFAALIIGSGIAFAQNQPHHGHDHPPQGEGRPGHRQPRKHTTVQTEEKPRLNPAVQEPIAPNQFTNVIEGEWRIIKANAIATHNTGKFPGRGNPNEISEQSIDIRVPANPKDSGRIRPVKDFGWTVEGVPFDPGAAEFYLGDRSSGWQYEALSGAIRLGLDESHAHVQPQGKYHYHGLPTLLMETLGVSSETHSPLIGWAADGFPIYALYGYSDPLDPSSKVIELTSSYQVKEGGRPDGKGQPGGIYDGTFTADYEFVKDSGSLDECNGRFAITTEYPNGTYAYFLSSNWPVVPRMVRGTPHPSTMGGPRGNRPPRGENRQ